MGTEENYQQKLTDLLAQEVAVVSSEYAENIDFSTDSGTRELVEDMKKGHSLDTRLFLRPIYKLCKHMITDEHNSTVPRTSECWIPFQKALTRREPEIEVREAGIRWRNHTNFAASIAIAEWLVKLTQIGDEKLGLKAQRHLQPVYAYNTIITMAQRASAALEARAAYGRMCFHNLSPDVFTLTALIDVFGRAHECRGSYWLFRRMASHGLAPNVVTCVTASRVSIVHGDDEFFLAVIDELVRLNKVATVQESHLSQRHNASIALSGDESTELHNASIALSGDESTELHNASIALSGDESTENVKRMSSIVTLSSFECCIGAERFDLAKLVLTTAGELGVPLSQEALINVLRDLYLDEFEGSNAQHLLLIALGQWEDMKLVPPGTTQMLRTVSKHDINSLTKANTHSHRESLGKNSPPELRREVVEHDLSRLEYRLQAKGRVSKEDFETLIHQCRKRKWCSEVWVVLQAMQRLSMKYPYLHPNVSTALVAIDAYVDSGESSTALQLLSSITASRSQDIDESLDGLGLLDQGWCQISPQCGQELCHAYTAVARGAAREGNVQLVYDTAKGYFKQLNYVAVDSSDEAHVHQIRTLVGSCMKALGSSPSLALQLLNDYVESCLYPSTICLPKMISLLIESSSIVTRGNQSVHFILHELNTSHAQSMGILRDELNELKGCYPPLCIAALMSSATIAVYDNPFNSLSLALKFCQQTFLNEAQVKILANLPLFPCILLEAFGRCPNPVLKSTVPKNKRKLPDEAIPEVLSTKAATVGSLPFTSIIRPSLLSSIHKRVHWLCIVLKLMSENEGLATPSTEKISETLDNADDDDDADDDNDDDNDDDDDSGGDVCISTETLKAWEAYFEPAMKQLWTVADTNTLDSPAIMHECTDRYLQLISENDLANNELGALLRLQRIYVRTLNTQNKQDRETLQSDLKFIFGKKMPSSDMLILSLCHIHSTHLMLPDKMQGKLAKFICESVQMRCGELDLPQITEALKHSPIEVMKEFFKCLIVPCIEQDMTEQELKNKGLLSCMLSLQLLIKQVLSMIQSKRDKMMKVASFLREVRVQLTALEVIFMPKSKNHVNDLMQEVLSIILALYHPLDSPLGSPGDYTELDQQEKKTETLSSECLGCLVSVSEGGMEKELVLMLKQKGYIHVAAQLACRFALTSDPVFLELVHESDRINFQSLNQLHMNDIGRKEPNTLTLQMLGCQYHLVNDLPSVQQAVCKLQQEGTTEVGIDAEWQPFMLNTSAVPVAVLQVSTPTDAFLFDLIELEGMNDNINYVERVEGSEAAHPTALYRNLIHWLFATGSITKYGFGVKEDIRRLKESYGTVFADMQVYKVVDLRDDLRFKLSSLSSALEDTVGMGLDKSMQTSNWGRRPLSEQQMIYAALDARCVLELKK